MDDPSLPTDLNDIAPWIERSLARGASDPRSAFHWLTLTSVDGTGRPQARTVVLREFCSSTNELVIFTDRRSTKVADVEREPRTGLHVYDARKRVQLRLEGSSQLETCGERWERAWARAKQGTLLDYGREPGPGTPIDTPTSGEMATIDSVDTFTVLIFTLQKADYLHLGREQHRRAQVIFTLEGSSATWLVP